MRTMSCNWMEIFPYFCCNTYDDESRVIGVLMRSLVNTCDDESRVGPWLTLVMRRVE